MLFAKLAVGASIALLTACGQGGPPEASEATAPTKSVSPSAEASPTETTSEEMADEPTETSEEPTEPTDEASATERPDSSAPSPRGRRIKTAGSQFGTMLFDGSGQAIYLFDREKTSRAQCYGECAVEWPPVLTKGAPQPVGGVRAGLLGTTERRNGSVQVTYGGHPLYYYAHEGKNQVLCHDVPGFGGLWLVVTPDGEPAP